MASVSLVAGLPCSVTITVWGFKYPPPFQGKSSCWKVKLKRDLNVLNVPRGPVDMPLTAAAQALATPVLSVHLHMHPLADVTFHPQLHGAGNVLIPILQTGRLRLR